LRRRNAFAHHAPTFEDWSPIMILTRTLAAAAMLCTALTAGPAAAQQGAAPPDKAAVEKIVRDYLMEHPEVIIEAVEAFKQRAAEAERLAAEQAVKSRASDIYRDPASPVGGNPKGDVVVVEFFDYRCGVCKNVHPSVTKLLADDPGIKIVYKEWPILGPESVFAARAALASRAQGKYLPFHNALMETRGRLDATIVFSIAARLGMNIDKLRRDMEDPKVNDAIRKNYALAEALKLDGTPSFLIGNSLLRGARDLDTMRALVAKARKPE
jgi:protein-disulfide isomerase